VSAFEKRHIKKHKMITLATRCIISMAFIQTEEVKEREKGSFFL